MPTLGRLEAKMLVDRRHPEWLEFQAQWRWLADSREGGPRYARADYRTEYLNPRSRPQGLDFECEYGWFLQRNLIPHQSEVGPGRRDTYEMRRERTPVPRVFDRVMRRHLSRIFAREVRREGPADLEAWWGDVDGCGTPIDAYARKQLAPLLLTYGHIDVCFDFFGPDVEASVLTVRDQIDTGSGALVIGHILPENMVWWEKDRRGRYTQCLVAERDEMGNLAFRHWTADDSVAYTVQGIATEQPIVHGLGFVPIVRLFDDRLLRCRNVGMPRYQHVAELQKAMYNLLSEQVLGDVYQAHPQWVAPEEMLEDGDPLDPPKLKMGPEHMMLCPVRENVMLKPECLDVPKTASEDRRQHLADYGDEVIADAALTRPAGTVTGSSSSGVVAQSGLSKMMDSQWSNDNIAEISGMIGNAERIVALMALAVMGKPVDPRAVTIIYPKEFDLYTPEDFAAIAAEFVSLCNAEAAPETAPIMADVLKRYVRLMFPGTDDDTLATYDDAIDDMIEGKAERSIQARELSAETPPQDDPLRPVRPDAVMAALASDPMN